MIFEFQNRNLLVVNNSEPRKSDYLSVDLSQKALPRQGIFWVKAKCGQFRRRFLNDDNSNKLKDSDETSEYDHYSEQESKKVDYRLVGVNGFRHYHQKAADGTLNLCLYNLLQVAIRYPVQP